MILAAWEVTGSCLYRIFISVIYIYIYIYIYTNMFHLLENRLTIRKYDTFINISHFFNFFFVFLSSVLSMRKHQAECKPKSFVKLFGETSVVLHRAESVQVFRRSKNYQTVFFSHAHLWFFVNLFEHFFCSSTPLNFLYKSCPLFIASSHLHMIDNDL